MNSPANWMVVRHFFRCPQTDPRSWVAPSPITTSTSAITWIYRDHLVAAAPPPHSAAQPKGAIHVAHSPARDSGGTQETQTQAQVQAQVRAQAQAEGVRAQVQEQVQRPPASELQVSAMLMNWTERTVPGSREWIKALRAHAHPHTGWSVAWTDL